MIKHFISAALAAAMLTSFAPKPIQNQPVPGKDDEKPAVVETAVKQKPEPRYELVCHKDEHVHTDACYEFDLVCGKEETSGHKHSEKCYGTEDVLTCGLEEYSHKHSDACYEETVTYICGLEEGDENDHHHTDECKQVERKLICDLVEGEHKHDKSCYTAKKVLKCGKEEIEPHHHTDECYERSSETICGLSEHTHGYGCWSNVTADVETQTDWDHMFDDFDFTGDWGKDVVMIAESQMGVRESFENFNYDDEGYRQGYTRYSDWYNRNVNPDKPEEWLQLRTYDAWCASFVSFCLNYAGVPREAVSWENGCHRWVMDFDDACIFEWAAEGYIPKPGDIVFFNFCGDWKSDHVGIVWEVDEEAGTMKTIEGNAADMVMSCTYSLRSSCLMGYCNLEKARHIWNKQILTRDKTDGLPEILMVN